MDYDTAKVDEMTLALMYLTVYSEDGAAKTWKGYEWETLGRLHKANLIHDPLGKAKSVMMTEEGKKLCQELFSKHFSKSA